MQSGIYLITCFRGEKLPLYYVGQSVWPERRWSVHRSCLARGNHVNEHFQRAWLKYGEGAFQFAVVERVDRSLLDEAELWWLAQMVGSDRCLNVLATPAGGARAGVHHYAFGKPLTVSHRKSISVGGRGLRRSASTRASISKAVSGDKNPMFGVRGKLNPRSLSVTGRNLSDGSVRTYESACMAEADGFSQESISRCCNGRQRTHLGFVWSFVNRPSSS